MTTEKIPVVDVALMRASDAYTIEHLIGDARLMDRAGRGIAELTAFAGPFAVVCGPGNNGGDGYVAARYLAERGESVTVFYTKEPTSASAREHRALLDGTSVEVLPYTPDCTFTAFGTVIDCLLGTGFTGVPRGLVADAIRAINEAGETGSSIVSADVNCGIDADTGEGTLFVKSDLTVTIGFLKVGMLAPSMGACASVVATVDIGIELAGEPTHALAADELPSWIDLHRFTVDDDGVHTDDASGAAE